jgi:hypothetical protein
VTRREGRLLQLGPAFQLVADDATVPADLLGPTARDVTVAVTATEHEADAFTVPDPRVRAMSWADVRTALRPLLGESTDDRLAQQTRRDPDATAARVAADLVTAHYFHDDLEPLVHVSGLRAFRSTTTASHGIHRGAPCARRTASICRSYSTTSTPGVTARSCAVRAGTSSRNGGGRWRPCDVSCSSEEGLRETPSPTATTRQGDPPGRPTTT